MTWFWCGSFRSFPSFPFTQYMFTGELLCARCCSSLTVILKESEDLRRWKDKYGQGMIHFQFHHFQSLWHLQLNNSSWNIKVSLISLFCTPVILDFLVLIWPCFSLNIQPFLLPTLWFCSIRSIRSIGGWCCLVLQYVCWFVISEMYQWEKSVDVCNYNCDFFSFFFWAYQLLFMSFEALRPGHTHLGQLFM